MRRARRRAVFLDRDGVLTATAVVDGKPVAPRRLSEFRLLPGVVAAVRSLRRAGFFVCVVTNQPDIGNRLVDTAVVAEIHARLRRALPIDALKMCPHRQDAGCACRKPKPGMLLATAQRHRVDLAMSYMIGDRYSDVLAGVAAGCYTIFIRRGYGESRKHRIEADFITRSLPEAARLILSRLSRGL